MKTKDLTIKHSPYPFLFSPSSPRSIGPAVDPSAGPASRKQVCLCAARRKKKIKTLPLFAQVDNIFHSSINEPHSDTTTSITFMNCTSNSNVL